MNKKLDYSGFTHWYAKEKLNGEVYRLGGNGGYTTFELKDGRIVRISNTTLGLAREEFRRVTQQCGWSRG